MDRNTAANTMRFMERTNLQGAEAPAFFECMKALDAIANASQENSAQNGNVTTIGRAPGVGTGANGEGVGQPEKGPSAGRV